MVVYDACHSHLRICWRL